MAEVTVLMLMFGGSAGSGLMGIPPAERDTRFVDVAPADSLVYTEWAARSGGKAGAPGVDGFFADPEVRLFAEQVERAILTAIEQSSAQAGPEAQIAGKAVPPLVKALLLRPGCAFARFDSQAAAQAVENGTPFPAAIASGVQAAVIVNGGDRADEIKQSLLQLVQLLPAEARQDDLQKQPLPLPIPVPLVLHQQGRDFVLAFGDGVLDQALAALSGEGDGGLGQSKRFTAAVEKVALERTGSLTWIDVESALKTATEVLGLQGAVVTAMAKSTGADAIDTLATATGVVDGRITTRTYVSNGGTTERIFALAAGRSLTARDFDLVPADADLVSAFSLNGPKVLAATRKVIAESDLTGTAAQGFDEYLKQLDRELGFSIEKDLFEAVGDVWTIHDSPSSGGVLVTGLTASVEVEDPQKAYTVFTQLMTVLESALPGDVGGTRGRGVYLEQKKFMDRTIYFVNTVGDDDIPFAPAFCFTDEQILAAPHPQALKAHLRFLASDDPRYSSRLKDASFPQEGHVLAYSHVDAKQVVQLVNAFAPYFMQVAFSEMQEEGIDLDVFALPSARGLLPYVSDGHGWCVRTENGILLESSNPLPVPGGMSFVLNAPMMGFWMFQVRRFGAMERAREAQAVAKEKAAVKEKAQEAAQARDEAKRAAAKARAAAKPAQAKAAPRPDRRDTSANPPRAAAD